MSRFYAEIQGSRGEATRCGTAASGIRGHVRGWEVGGQVSVNDNSGNDIVNLMATKGSNGNSTFTVATIFRRGKQYVVRLRNPKTGDQVAEFIL